MQVAEPGLDPGQKDASEVLRVSSGANPKDIGHAVFTAVTNGDPISLRAIGAAAVNQAIKGLIIGRKHAAAAGIDLTFIPGFEDVRGTRGDMVNGVVLRVLVR